MLNAADKLTAWNLIESKFSAEECTDPNALRVELDTLFEAGDLTTREYRLIDAALDEYLG